MGRRAQTERRINGIAVMFAPLVMAAKEREAQEKKRAKAERDAKAKREKRAKEAQRKALEQLAADWSGRNA